MTVVKCLVCGKEVKPVKPDRRRPYMVFYVNKPCDNPDCNGKIDLLAK